MNLDPILTSIVGLGGLIVIAVSVIIIFRLPGYMERSENGRRAIERNQRMIIQLLTEIRDLLSTPEEEEV